MKLKSAAPLRSHPKLLHWLAPWKRLSVPRLSILSPASLALALLSLGGLRCAGQDLVQFSGGTDGTSNLWIGPSHWYSEQFVGGGTTLKTYYSTPPGTEAVTSIIGTQVELTPPSGHFDAVTGSDFRISNGGLWIHGDVTLTSQHVAIAETLFSLAGVRVSGANALWQTTGDMGVGQANDSQGALTVENGGTVKVGNNGLFLGYGDRSTGTLNVGNYDRTTTGGYLQLTNASGKIIFSNGGALSGQEGHGIINFNQTDTIDFATLLYSSKPGFGQIVQRGTGTTKLLYNQPDFTGAIRVESGDLWLFGTNNATLYDIAGGTLQMYADRFTPTVAFVTGSGTLNILPGQGSLNGAVTFAMTGGLIDLDSGTNFNTPIIFSGSNGGNENWAANKSSLHLSRFATFWGNEGNIRVDALNGEGTIHSGYNGMGSFTVGVNNGSGTFSGVLADDDTASGHIGHYFKEGTGTQILTGANTFTGGLTVTGGFVQVNADANLGAASGALTLNGGGIKFGAAFNNLRSFTIGSNGGWIDTNGLSVTAPQNISGAGALIKQGDGTLTLTGTNTQGGSIVIKLGTVSVASDASLGASGATVTIDGGTLALTNSTGFSRPLSIGNNTGAISVAAGKFVVWNGNASGSGNTTLSKNDSGTLWVAGDVNLGSVHVSAGSFVAAGMLNLSSNAVIAGGSSLVLNYDTGGSGGHRDFTGSTTFSGAGTLIKTGDGDVHWGYFTSSAAATFALASGSLIDVQAGGFSGGNGSNETWTYNKSGLRVNSGATFYGNEAYIRVDALTDGALGGGTVRSGWSGAGSITVGVDDGSGAFSGVLADTDKAGGHIGTLIKDGTGTQTLTGNNTYTGPTTVINGTLALTGDTKSSAFTLGLGAATLEFNLASDRDYGTVTFDGFGILKKTGAGRLYWGTSTATFALNSGSRIDVQGGTFTGGSNANESWTNNKSDLNVATGATFNGVEADVRVDALTGGGLITSGYSAAQPGSFTFGVDNGSGTFSGVLANGSNPGRFIKAGTGTQILTGANTYTGGTTITAGTLQIGNGGVSGSISGNVSNNGSLVFNRSDNITYNNIISGAGTLTQRGPGTLTLTGANTFSGGTTVTGGTLQLGSSGATLPDIGTVHVIDGTLALGAPIETIGSLLLESLGALAFDLSSAASYERLTITNGVTLSGGTLRVALANGYTPGSGTTFDLMDWGGPVNGTFSGFDLPALNQGLFWDTSQFYTNGSLTVVPEPSVFGLLLPGVLILSRPRRRRRAVK